jgi:fibrillarin-like pre-rRNA processing protein
MNPTQLKGLFHDRGLMWTINRVPGTKVYGERLRVRQNVEYRQWNPWRSKLAALAQVNPKAPWIEPEADVLYLGASSGTTVSHVSDLLGGDAQVYAVEFSPRSTRDLLWNMEPRQNVVPILDDAGKPERYAPYLDRFVGALVQDVAQRHQVDIFLRNLPFLRKGGHGFLFIKARSIDVASPLSVIYDKVRAQLKEAGCNIVLEADLEPYEREHRAFVVRK